MCGDVCHNATLVVWRLQVIREANGRPVVIMNPRLPYTPVEIEEFETVYQLRQYNVQPVKTNPKVSWSVGVTV